MLTALMTLDIHPDSPSPPTDHLEPAAGSSSKSKTSTRKIHRYNHDVDIIFDLPGLQLHMKTEHPQKHLPPLATGEIV